MRVHPVTAIYVLSPTTKQAAEKQVSSLRKERDAAQSRVDKAVRGLDSLGYDKGQEDGLDEEKEQEEKTVDHLKEVRGLVPTCVPLVPTCLPMSGIHT